MIEAEKSIDSSLRELLMNAGADDYIPIFAMRGITLKQLAYMKDLELSEVRSN